MALLKRCAQLLFSSPALVMPIMEELSQSLSDAASAPPAGRHTIALVDVATRKVTGYVKVGARPWHLGLSADDRFAIVANGLSDDVSMVDLATLAVVASVKVGAGPWGVAVAP